MKSDVISLEANGIALFLPDDLQLTFTNNNTLFQIQFFADDDPTGVYNFSLKIPRLQNAQILNFPDNPNNLFEFNLPIQVRGKLSGSIWQQGDLYIQNFDNDNLDILINFAISAQINKNQTLKEVFSEITYSLPSKSRNWNYTDGVQLNYIAFVASGASPTVGFRCVVHGDTSGTYSHASIISIIDEINVNSGTTKINAVVSPAASGGDYDDILFYSNSREIFGVEFYITGTRGGFPDELGVACLQVPYLMRNLVGVFLLNTYPSANFCLPAFFNDNAYDDKNALITGRTQVNERDTTGYNNRNNFHTERQFEHTLVPCLFLMNVVDKIFQLNGIRTQGSFFTNIDLKKICIWNNQTIDEAYILQKDRSAPLYMNVFKEQFLAADHLPDMKVGDFLMSLQFLFGVTFSWDPKQEVLNGAFSKDILPVMDFVDYTKLADPKIEGTFNKYKGYKFTIPAEPNDKYSKEDNYIHGVGSDGIESKIGVIQYIDANLPTVSMPLGSDMLNIPNTGFVPRLLYYLPDYSSGQAFSNFKGINKSGTRVSNIDLQWNGTTSSLIPLFWALYLIFLQNAREFTAYLSLSIQDLKNIGLNVKMKIKTTLFYFKSLEISMTKSVLNVTKAILSRYI